MKRITSGPRDGAGKAVGPRGGESDKRGNRGGGAPRGAGPAAPTARGVCGPLAHRGGLSGWPQTQGLYVDLLPLKRMKLPRIGTSLPARAGVGREAHL